MKKARIFLITIGALGLGIFLVPSIIYNLKNIGSYTGIAVFFALFLAGVFFNPLSKGLKFLWKYLVPRIILKALIIVAFAIFSIALIETVFMIKEANNSPESGSNATLIVLGCRVYGESPSIMLNERIDAAYNYLEANPKCVAILSGGKGDGENISEAECMKRELVAKGIDESRLYVEDRSTSTRENLAFSLEIIKKQGLNDNIALVSNEFHLFRASLVAKDLGIKTNSVKANTKMSLLPIFYVRELWGILYQLFL